MLFLEHKVARPYLFIGWSNEVQLWTTSHSSASIIPLLLGIQVIPCCGVSRCPPNQPQVIRLILFAATESYVLSTSAPNVHKSKLQKFQEFAHFLWVRRLWLLTLINFFTWSDMNREYIWVLASEVVHASIQSAPQRSILIVVPYFFQIHMILAKSFIQYGPFIFICNWRPPAALMLLDAQHAIQQTLRTQINRPCTRRPDPVWNKTSNKSVFYLSSF